MLLKGVKERIEHDSRWTIRRFQSQDDYLCWAWHDAVEKLRSGKLAKATFNALASFLEQLTRVLEGRGLVNQGGRPHLPGFEASVVEGNLLLNEGITALQNLLTGAAETAFNNANSNCGVGNSATAEVATQTGLLGASKLYKTMEATYPQISAQTTTWRSQFGSAEANFAWEEFTVASGTSDAADNLNRKTSSEGTKTAGQTWTLDLAMTWS